MWFGGSMMIIDIEGTDGSGKKTQTDLLYNKLVSLGKKCLKISFPNYDSPSSAPVKMYLGGELGNSSSCLNPYQASSLFAVDRLITLKKIDLNAYDFVLFDRYVPSNMIHQSTNLKSLKEMDDFLDFIDDFEYNKLELPRPDLTIFLNVPVEVSFRLAKERINLKNGLDKDILENIEHLERAYNSANYVARKFNWLTIDCVDNLNDLKSVQAIHDEILSNLSI